METRGVSEGIRPLQFHRHFALAYASGFLLLFASFTFAEEASLQVGSFSLTERSGKTITEKDLNGKVWVASFVFIRCTQGCPQVTATMQKLQEEFKDKEDFRLVTFTVDPKHDDTEKLKKYAEHFDADPKRWLFLTGEQEQIYKLLREGFRVGVEENTGEKRTPGNEVTHSTRLVLVDREGHIQGYYEGLPASSSELDETTFRDSQRNLFQTTKTLLNEKVQGRIGESPFPTINATLNGLSGILLIAGFIAIRRKHITLHRNLMIGAFAVSVIFLGCYLYYHLVVKAGQPMTKFADKNPMAPTSVRYFYYFILSSHTILAAFAAPMAIRTLVLGLRDDREKHRWWAKLTFPIWLYVAITGVVVYWMLYRLY